MLIKNLSKEIDTKAMTEVRGGSADNQVWTPVYNVIEQSIANKVVGNNGPVQIDNSESASESTYVPNFTNYGLILEDLFRRSL